MKPTLLIKQHQKCLEILAMIGRCEYFIWEYKIRKHDEDASFTYVIYCENGIEKYKAIRSRLINYYANTFNKMQITEPA